MSRLKGTPKTGGRQVGTKNRASIAKEEALAKSGMTPLEYLLSVMRAGDATKAEKIDAAKAAAPYVHPKLAAVTHSGSVGTYDLSQVPTDALRQLENILGSVALAGADTSGDS